MEYSILVLEGISAAIIMIAGVRALISILHKDPRKSRLLLSGGITTALSFLLGGEVLNTIIAPDWATLGEICAILVMRAAMAVLLHWEKKNEQNEEIEKK